MDMRHEHDGSGYHWHLALPDSDVQQAHYFAHQDEPFKFLELFWGHEPSIHDVDMVAAGISQAHRDEAEALQRYLRDHPGKTLPKKVW
jgi:hypothetical protein